MIITKYSIHTHKKYMHIIDRSQYIYVYIYIYASKSLDSDKYWQIWVNVNILLITINE